jgi:hypothetical protein
MKYLKIPATSCPTERIFDFDEIGNCVLFATMIRLHVSGQNQLQCRDIDTMAFNSSWRKQGRFSFGFRVFYRLSLFIHKVFNQSNASTLRVIVFLKQRIEIACDTHSASMWLFQGVYAMIWISSYTRQNI